MQLYIYLRNTLHILKISNLFKKKKKPLMYSTPSLLESATISSKEKVVFSKKWSESNWRICRKQVCVLSKLMGSPTCGLISLQTPSRFTSRCPLYHQNCRVKAAKTLLQLSSIDQSHPRMDPAPEGWTQRQGETLH